MAAQSPPELETRCGVTELEVLDPTLLMYMYTVHVKRLALNIYS